MMHTVVCLASLLLTFQLTLLKASTFTHPSKFDENATFSQILSSNSSAESEVTVHLSQEAFTHNSITSEVTSLTSSSLDFTLDEFLNSSSTASSITKDMQTDAYITQDLHSETETDVANSSYLTDTSSIPPKATLTSSLTNSVPSKDNETHETSTKKFLNISLLTENATHAGDRSYFPPSFAENVTSFEETVEHNAILTTDFEDVTDRGSSFVVAHKCTKVFQESILWNDTDGGMLALKSCPSGYQGNVYRPCFNNGKWGNVDYRDCRLEHLGRMRHMIFYQVQKGMLGNMYILADEFSKYISSVDVKSPMDRLEAFEILNAFLKLDMNLRMDKSRDIKYIQALLHASNELIKIRSILFSPETQKNKLITEKAVEMVFDLTNFAERALRGLIKTQKKQIAFRNAPNVVLYLYRGKLSNQFTLVNFSSDYERDDDLPSSLNLEETLQRSAYALFWIKGLKDLLSTSNLLVNSDVAVATILSPLNSLNHLLHRPTFDVGLRMKKSVPDGYILKCGQLWNISHLWNTDDCTKVNVKGNIVTCRCHHLGSIALLLEEESQDSDLGSSGPVGRLITVSCATSLAAIAVTLVINSSVMRREKTLSVLILMSLLLCMATIQLLFMFGLNKTEFYKVCWTVALSLHYLFLVSCCWVLSYSVYLLLRLRSSMEYTGKIRDYIAFSWIFPSILMIMSFIGNPRGYETKQYCWLNVQKGILWSFVIPVTGLIVVNTTVMILALKTFNEQMSVTHRLEICKTRNSMRAGIILLPFFAINWFFGILAVGDPFNAALQFIFSLTNSLQGILTFIFFCIMDKNVQMSFRLKLGEVSRKPKVSAMKLKKSGSFPIIERSLISLSDESRRLDCTPLLSSRRTYSEAPEDPCCSNIRV